MEQNYTNKKPIRATLRDMKIGDIVNFPKSRTSVVRSSASSASLELDRKYESRLNRETGMITVTRTA